MDYYQLGASKCTFNYRNKNIQAPSVVNGLNVSFWYYFVIKAFSCRLLCGCSSHKESPLEIETL